MCDEKRAAPTRGMTTAAKALWIAALCALVPACSGDDGGGGSPDAGIFDDPGDSDDDPAPPDAGHQPPSEECAGSCAGCCDGDACLSGTSPTACGSGGGSCAVCDPGYVCEAAACTVDRTSRWDVLADSADVFEDNAGGTPWDPSGGLPDPYVEMTINDGVEDLHGTSDSPADTLAPSWNQVILEEVAAGALLDSGITTTVLDDDPLVDPSDSMGTCLVTFDDADFTGDVLTAVCPFDADAGARGWTLRLRLIRK
jgi:hypothetical protein